LFPIRAIPLSVVFDSVLKNPLSPTHIPSMVQPIDKVIRASQPLQLVQSNLMGLFQTKSLGGASYVLNFINEFSRMKFGYLLEHKDQIFESFKNFKTLVKNQTNLKIKMLRSDNGGEYNNNEFNIFCAKYGIKR